MVSRAPRYILFLKQGNLWSSYTKAKYLGVRESGRKYSRHEGSFGWMSGSAVSFEIQSQAPCVWIALAARWEPYVQFQESLLILAHGCSSWKIPLIFSFLKLSSSFSEWHWSQSVTLYSAPVSVCGPAAELPLLMCRIMMNMERNCCLLALACLSGQTW